MADFPKYSVELLQMLAEEIPRPEWPKTAAGAAMLNDQLVRQYIWFAAQRALVDSLLSQVEDLEQEKKKDDEADDNAYWGSGSGPRVLPAALDIHQASVGAVEGVDTGPSGTVSDNADP